MRKPGGGAKSLALIMLVLVGLSIGNALPVVTQSTVVVAASESNSNEYSRTRTTRNPDSRTRSISTVTGGSPLSVLSGPDESLAQASAPAVNGKIAFARALSLQEVRVMNADGSNQMHLTNSPGVDRSPVWSPDGTRIAFESGRDGNEEIYVMNAVGTRRG